MASKSRAQLRKATALFGYDGCLVVFKNRADPTDDSREADSAAGSPGTGNRGGMLCRRPTDTGHPRQPPC